MPAYNAGKTIEKVFARIPKETLGRIRRYVVVDDGSTDDTGKALTRIAADFPNLVILSHNRNLGYGAAEKTLLKHAASQNAGAALLLHSDGQYSPESMPELLAPLDRNEADLIQGSRMMERGGALRGGMPYYKYVANRCLTAIENRGFGMKMAEYHSGYMLYSREILLAVPFEKFSNSFDFDLEMIVAARILGLRIRQIPIPTIYGGEVSYLNPFRYGMDVLKVVMRYRKGYYHDLLDVPLRR